MNNKNYITETLNGLQCFFYPVSKIKQLISEKKHQIIFLGIVKNMRSHGNINFIDVVFYHNKDNIKTTQVIQLVCKFKISNIKLFDVIKIKGNLELRQNNFINTKILTGNIEIQTQEINVVIKSQNIPFDFLTDNIELIHDDIKNNNRFLTLRNPKQQNYLKIKSDFYFFTRLFFRKHNFLEINTPILTQDSKEGSRVFKTPSRLHKNKFFAMAQSPQVYKQALMCGFIQKYYQLANVFRDEDVRSDRQPEFQQLDVEISFCNQKKIFKLFHDFLKFIFNNVFDKKLFIFNDKIPILTYKKSMFLFNTDEPNIIWHKNLNKKILFSKIINFEEKDLLFFTSYDKFFWSLKKQYINKYSWLLNKYLSFINGKWKQFCWIVDFPMFEKNNTKIELKRHIFTQPKITFEKLQEIKNNKKQLLNIITYSYDLIIDGREILSGSIRNHQYNIQKIIIEILNLNSEQEFNYFLNMLKYGAPIHGGFALGVERFLHKILQTKNISNFIAFPKNRKFECSLTKAPN